jgi:hypothetical protein
MIGALGGVVAVILTVLSTILIGLILYIVIAGYRLYESFRRPDDGSASSSPWVGDDHSGHLSR